MVHRFGFLHLEVQWYSLDFLSASRISLMRKKQDEQEGLFSFEMKLVHR